MIRNCLPMVLHLKKLCVGISTVQELAESVEQRLCSAGDIYHTTRHFPRRAEEILASGKDGGSLYWIIERKIQVRQRITAFRRGQKRDGTPGWEIGYLAFCTISFLDCSIGFQGVLPCRLVVDDWAWIGLTQIDASRVEDRCGRFPWLMYQLVV